MDGPLPDGPPGVGREVLQGLAYPLLRLLEEGGPVAVLDEAARDQLEAPIYGAGRALDREVDDDQAVLGERCRSRKTTSVASSRLSPST